MTLILTTETSGRITKTFSHKKSPTCFQSTNPTRNDLILTNQEDFFSNSNTCEVGISDHHRLLSTMLNKKFRKAVPELYFIETIRCLKLNCEGFNTWITKYKKSLI